MKLSIIFEDEPNIGWASRGNPPFWEHLKKCASGVDIPMSAEMLENWIRGEYNKLTGEVLTIDSDVYVTEFDSGGMSAGRVTGEWWITSGIQILKERLERIVYDQDTK